MQRYREFSAGWVDAIGAIIPDADLTGLTVAIDSVTRIDSSGWLEYFSDGSNAVHYLPPLEDTSALIVPVVTIYEVFKVVLRESAENEALQAVAAMQKGRIVDLDANLAMDASKLSLQHHFNMADGIILATARAYDCVIWTQDSDFQHIEGVNYFPAQKSPSKQDL